MLIIHKVILYIVCGCEVATEEVLVNCFMLDHVSVAFAFGDLEAG